MEMLKFAKWLYFVEGNCRFALSLFVEKRREAALGVVSVKSSQSWRDFALTSSQTSSFLPSFQSFFFHPTVGVIIAAPCTERRREQIRTRMIGKGKTFIQNFPLLQIFILWLNERNVLNSLMLKNLLFMHIWTDRYEECTNACKHFSCCRNNSRAKRFNRFSASSSSLGSFFANSAEIKKLIFCTHEASKESKKRLFLHCGFFLSLFSCSNLPSVSHITVYYKNVKRLSFLPSFY